METQCQCSRLLRGHGFRVVNDSADKKLQTREFEHCATIVGPHNWWPHGHHVDEAAIMLMRRTSCWWGGPHVDDANIILMRRTSCWWGGPHVDEADLMLMRRTSRWWREHHVDDGKLWRPLTNLKLKGSTVHCKFITQKNSNNIIGTVWRDFPGAKKMIYRNFVVLRSSKLPCREVNLFSYVKLNDILSMKAPRSQNF